MNHLTFYFRKNNMLTFITSAVVNLKALLAEDCNTQERITEEQPEDSIIFDRAAYYAYSKNAVQQETAQQSQKESLKNTHIKRSFQAQGNLW